MPDPLLFTLLVDLAPHIVARAASVGERWLEDTPVELAIADTEAAFEGYELSPSLNRWCSSPAFLEMLRSVTDGQRVEDLDAIADSFVTVGEFHAGDQTLEVAREVVSHFIHSLWRRLVKSEEGLVVVAKTVIREIQDVGRSTNAAIASIARGESSTGTHSGVIDAARDLIRSGRTRAARQLLLKLREESRDDLDSDSRFRIATNLGACALRDGDLDAAEREFAAAVVEKPEEPKGVANAAFVDVLTGRVGRALERLEGLWTAGNREPHTAAVLILALAKAAQWDQLQQIRDQESWLLDDADCAAALGQAYWEAQRYTDASYVLARAAELDPNRSEVLILSALALYEPAHDKLMSEFAPEVDIPADIRSTFEQGKSLLLKAASILEDQDENSRLLDCYAGLAGIEALLGDDEAALQLCERVLVDDGLHPVALRNKGIILLGRDSRAASEVLEEAVQVDESVSLRLALAHAYSLSREPEKAIASLSHLRLEDLTEAERVQFTKQMSTAYLAQGRQDASDELIRRLEEESPGNPEVLILKASLLTGHEDAEARISLLRQALVLASGPTRVRAAIDLGDARFEAEQYCEAADLYSGIGVEAPTSPLARRLVVALFNCGRRKQALELARELRAGGPALPVITEIELLILEQEQSVAAAFELAKDLAQQEPDKGAHQVRSAVLAVRLHREDLARELVEAIDYDTIRSSAPDLINVALLRSQLGMDRALEFAYRAYRVARNDPEIEVRFLSLVLTSEGRSPDDIVTPAPAHVDIGTTTRLKHNDGTVTVVTIEADEPGLLPHEVAPDSFVAQTLQRHAEGDTVTLKDSSIERIDVEVADIRHAWVAAFQDSIATFTTRYPDFSGFYRIKVDENDLSPIFVAIDERHKLISQVLDWYQNNPLPIGAVAYLSGTSEIEVWTGLISTRGQKVRAASGSAEEQAAQATVLAPTKRLVVDVTGVLTISALGFEEKLVEAFPEIIVAQSVLELLTEDLAKNYMAARPSMILGKEGEQYTRTEVTDEDIERGKAFMERMRSFLTSHTQLRATEAGLNLEPKDRSGLTSLIGRAALATALIASEEEEVVLYSDDRFFRELAADRWNVDGVWTQPLLKEMLHRDVLIRDEYQDALVRLAASNYSFISVGADDFIYPLRQDPSTRPEIARLFDLLHGPDCSEDSAVSIATAILRSLYLDPVFAARKALLADAVLAAVAFGRDSSRALARLEGAVDKAFRLMPIAHAEVVRSIRLWASQT